MNKKYTIRKNEEFISIIENSTGNIITSIAIKGTVTGKSIDSKQKIDTKICTKEFIEWLIDTEPLTCLNVPKTNMTKEQCQRCYESLSHINKKRFISKGYMEGLITSDMFKELLDGEKDSDYWYIDYVEKINREAYTQENAEKLLSKRNSMHIKNVPEEFLTFEMCQKAVELDYRNLSSVPIKYQTIELQKQALNKSYRAISYIPEEVLSDEIIRYALNISGHALAGIPEEMKTSEYCEIAFEKNPKSFSFIPDKFKTHEMCIKALLINPSLIQKVPAHIINEQFLNEINLLHIVIPKTLMGYVKECINANMKYNKPINLEEISKLQPVQMHEEIANISIDSLSPYFSGRALTYMQKNNIENLEQLCNMVNQPETLIEIKKQRIGSEIIGTTNLLRCKYLNEDPLIDIKSEESIRERNILSQIGLSTRAYNFILKISFMSINELFDLSKTDEFEIRLRNVIKNGNKVYNEIILKFRIINEYYDNLKKENEDSGKDNNKNVICSETLKELNNELKRLRDERNKIDTQIDLVLERIQAKTLEQSKTGGHK